MLTGPRMLKVRGDGSPVLCLRKGMDRQSQEHHGSQLTVSKRNLSPSLEVERTAAYTGKQTLRCVKWLLSDSVGCTGCHNPHPSPLCSPVPTPVPTHPASPCQAWTHPWCRAAPGPGLLSQVGTSLLSAELSYILPVKTEKRTNEMQMHST